MGTVFLYIETNPYPTLLALTIVSILTKAQTKATWGDEFKMNKRSTDLAVLAVDKTGEYLEESHEEARMFRGIHKSSELVKLSPQLLFMTNMKGLRSCLLLK
jgi:hypothetical protein